MPSARVRLPGPRQSSAVANDAGASSRAPSAPPPHERLAFERLERADEDGRGRPFGLGHGVHQVVHAVVEIHVRDAGATIERRVAAGRDRAPRGRRDRIRRCRLRLRRSRRPRCRRACRARARDRPDPARPRGSGARRRRAAESRQTPASPRCHLDPLDGGRRRRSHVAIGILFERRQRGHRRLIAEPHRESSRDCRRTSASGSCSRTTVSGMTDGPSSTKYPWICGCQPIGVDEVDEPPEVGDVTLLVEREGHRRANHLGLVLIDVGDEAARPTPHPRLAPGPRPPHGGCTGSLSASRDWKTATLDGCAMRASASSAEPAPSPFP